MGLKVLNVLFCVSLKKHFNDYSLMITADVEQPAVVRDEMRKEKFRLV